ncbi:DNA methyltransferase [Enterococcus faecalis]|uniref:DNA methyltransferase n=1 Tax=Enterococcus faecalis TaxID=1351 RepID=UPI0009D30FC5|nr:DNA methyltransferase [Enterococcus faecalis]MDG0921668.1 DNA methyltransferase [Enterococcus faecalis]OOL76388.1 chromosome partitioning protein ParB [Enterococcus faecalis]HBD0694790.1 ParB N-terminal domain-containing protein [Enterococcus faecalis]HBD0698100.1 ParB N-terminal domain-containing protein [Enterococcus faecalis]HBD0801951.1 ParB N-terminal domain-containing protein [Enterococcus faecalis]
MNIEKMKLSELHPADYNPRIELKPGMEEYEKLKQSIQEFGFVDPPIFNKRTGNLVGGHQRVSVAKDLGIGEIEVSIVDLPIEKEKALNIALNKISGQWDEDKLVELLNELNTDELSLTGFNQEELDDLLSDLDEIETLADKVKANPLNSNLFDSFLFPPFSYLDTKTKRWLDRKKQWKELGIKSELGREDNLVFSANLQATGLEGTSIFDPVLCELGYRWFTPKTESNIFDPFAGGSVRGIVAKVLGHNYTGIDLRAEQVSANYANAREIGLSDINWICDDSLNIDHHIEDESQDLLFTCPPYADLEVYSDDERDISNMSYEEFAEVYSEILKRSARKLKDNRFAVVTISDVRDKKGFYRDLTGLTKQAFSEEGLFFYNDMILLNTAGSAALRARQSMNNRKVVRIHQNVLVFYKGNPQKISKHFEALETLDDELETVLESLDE